MRIVRELRLLCAAIFACACVGKLGPDPALADDPEAGRPLVSADAALPHRTWFPPPNWDRLSLEAFEELVERELPPDVVTRFPKETVAELMRALDAMDQRSLRAVILLARSRSHRTAEALLDRLEKRVEGPRRESDAADCVAAAALARFPVPERYAVRVAALAAGPRPHPDLEVRVECAASALAHGRDEVIPFLLKVLRIDTPAGLEDRRDFIASPTTAWPRATAARALSARAGLPVTYQSDAPLVHREREAAALAAALQVTLPIR